MIATRKKKRLPRLRFALRHPIKTLRRNQVKSINRTGFGLLQLTGIGVFVVGVVGWVAIQFFSVSSP
ncbi:hypothetical protein ABZW18_00560 [Streptomyces sp. NPDC004647]|uniref:hypothetical protein n=1 Tax=Streptomyces sp. NPDC004647 TaxID=3154671 RepID=UPI0033B2FC14